jgi:hypothetical protein
VPANRQVLCSKLAALTAASSEMSGDRG